MFVVFHRCFKHIETFLLEQRSFMNEALYVADARSKWRLNRLRYLQHFVDSTYGISFKFFTSLCSSGILQYSICFTEDLHACPFYNYSLIYTVYENGHCHTFSFSDHVLPPRCCTSNPPPQQNIVSMFNCMAAAVRSEHD